MMKTDTRSYYSLPLLLALLLHIIVLGFLLVDLSFQVKSSASASSSSGSVIHASVMSQTALDNYENAVQAAKEAKIRSQQIAQQKILQQQKQEEEQQQEKAREAQLRQLQIQKQLELQQQRQAEAAKAIAQQKIMAAQKAAALQKAAQEKAMEKAMKKALQKSLAQDMQKELADDKPLPDTSHHAVSTTSNTNSSTNTQTISAGVMDKYKALIIQAISSQWIVPPNLPQTISCELDVRLAPGGIVLEVSVARSSGNPLLDNSAIAAVNKASPLPVPTESSAFDQFRDLHITVKPDGSMTA